MFSNIQGKYGLYVVAPIPDIKVRLMLERIEPNRLLVIDRHINMKSQYSFISQEFENNTYNKLVELLRDIRKYKKMILLFRDDADYPIGILNAFSKFVKQYNINATVVSI